jgi:lactoylglutathione lyase
MRYLHTMIRVADLDAALDFFIHKFGMVEVRRKDSEAGRFTLVYLAAPDDAAAVADKAAPSLELTHNWDEKDAYPGGRNFGHLAYEVEDVYATCDRLAKLGVVINRPPRDGNMAFLRTPDGISIELLQRGPALPPREPWKSAPNIGSW